MITSDCTHALAGIGCVRLKMHPARCFHTYTGGGPVSRVQLSEGGFQVIYSLGLWFRSSGVVKVLYGHG